MRTSVGAFDCGAESFSRCLGCFTGFLGKVNCHFTCVQLGLARLPCGLGLPFRLPCRLGRRCAVGGEQLQSLFPRRVQLSCCLCACFLVFCHLGLQVLAIGICT